MRNLWGWFTRLWVVGVLWLAASPLWAAHAYGQFGDVKYPTGFTHFGYVNPQAPKGGEIVLVPPTRQSNFDKYNPFTLKGSAPPGLTGLLFDTLLTGTMDEPTTAYGLLARDVAVAPDKKSVTFELHPLARFHTGDPVLAADVKFSFERLTSKEAAPQYRTYFSEVKAVVVEGERRIRFDFVRPSSELPLIVGSLPVFSRAWGQTATGHKPLDQLVTDIPIGSGPYTIGPVQFGKDITYVRDPNYWARDLNVRRGLYNFDRITYKIYKDSTAQLEAFKAGEFDYIQAFIAREWARAYTGRQFERGEIVKAELQHRNAGDFQGFLFNTRRTKFQDVRVRQAIALAMDYEWMNRPHRLGDAQGHRDQVADEEGPQAQTDGHRQFLLDQGPDVLGIEKALAQIEARKLAHHHPEALGGRFVKAVEGLDFLDPLGVHTLAATVTGAGSGGALAAHIASLKLGHHLFHRSARHELDDHKGHEQHPKQGRHHEQQAFEDVAQHGQFFLST